MSTAKDILLDHYHHPRNNALIKSPDFSSGQFNPSCGDMVHINGTTNAGRIHSIGFKAEGCVLTRASASLLTEHVKDKTVDEVSLLTKETMQELVGIFVGPNRLRCVLLPLHALQNALRSRTSA